MPSIDFAVVMVREPTLAEPTERRGTTAREPAGEVAL